MASYVGQTALTALWNKMVAVLAGKADRNSVYSKAEVDYKLATTYGTGSGSSGGDTSDCVHLTGSETIAGSKTFTGANTFSGGLTITGTNTQLSGTMTYANGCLKIRSASTSYSTIIYQSGASNRSLYLPPSTTTSQTLLSRSGTSSVTSGAVLQYSNTSGLVSTYTFQGSTLSSSTTAIPSSAAVKSYVDSAVSGSSGGSEWYNIDGYIEHSTPYAVLCNFDVDGVPGSGYMYYLMRFRRAHSQKKWSIPYLGIKYDTFNHWPAAKCRWAISTTYASTPFWSGSYSWSSIFSTHQTGQLSSFNGGGYTHTFGCAIFHETGGNIKRVSNIVSFTIRTDNLLTKRAWTI